MLQDVIPQPEQLPIEDISSPLSAQIFDFCDPDLFPETLQNSEVASSSNCCYEENSSYTTNLSFAPDIKFISSLDKNGTVNVPTITTTTTASTTTTTSTTTPTSTNNNNSNLSVIFDSPEEIENDISASIDFSPSPPFSVPPFLTAQQDQFDLSSLQSQIPVNGLTPYPPDPVVPLMGPTLPAVYEEECLSSMPSYVRLNPSSPSCSFLDHTIGPYLPGNLNAALSAENSGIFNGSMIMGTELQTQELEYQGDNGGIFCLEPLPQIINSTELQALSNESQHLVNGNGSSTPLASEISSLEDSTFKVGKLSVEQRKEKIHRYMKKRNERNFSKKIKYACRKTLADSRPRVRGRFAKNDEFGENPRTTCSNHEEDTDEDVVVKEEDDISSNIFAHINGVNSFKCNYPIQSWI
ncbi:zinc finger protein CONSTANS-LIKE 5-like [Cornus florida]|uniref:zinc finger protein CONSTANS-LIKE 5-like n=1 Tax=Cornus florida TaxID=4283 RepID=UPI002899D252|nr:zinc finger protein CONSTANS-LIKE 5-like [Cornus florida]